MTDKVSTAPGWSDETLKKVGAFLDDGHYSLGMCRSTYAALCCERERNAALSAEVERLKVVLRAAEQFIVNGTELGFIKMPTLEIDPAHKTLPMIRAALGE